MLVIYGGNCNIRVHMIRINMQYHPNIIPYRVFVDGLGMEQLHMNLDMGRYP